MAAILETLSLTHASTMHRRTFALAVGTATAASLPLVARAARAVESADASTAPWQTIESGVGGRLGVAVLDIATGDVSGWRMDDRFPMCSTFKFLLAAAVLKRVDEGRDRLENRVTFTQAALPSYSPSTSQHADRHGMTLAELCQAAVALSDNGAANLLLARLGGPSAVTRIARQLGDTATRLDRNEPTLNESRPGDPRDTTTPRQMAIAMTTALLGPGLTPGSRTRLADWLIECRTGANRLHAGIPADWRFGDKTGTGDHGSTNDVAIFWPPRRAPVLVAAYLTQTDAPLVDREKALAAVGREAARRSE